MPKHQKGSQEMKDFMKMVRSKKKGKKGDGFFGNILKSVGNTAVDYLPGPSFIKDIAKTGVSYGVDKTGLGMKKRCKSKYGSALLLP